jgi:hypothetical protein
MRKTIAALTKRLQKLNFVNRIFNGFPGPDFNVKGCFCDKEFIEQTETDPPIFIAPVIDFQASGSGFIFG